MSTLQECVALLPNPQARMAVVVYSATAAWSLVSYFLVRQRVQWPFLLAIALLSLWMLLIPAYEPLLYFLFLSNCIFCGVGRPTAAEQKNFQTLTGSFRTDLNGLFALTAVSAVVMAAFARSNIREFYIYAGLASAGLATSVFATLGAWCGRASSLKAHNRATLLEEVDGGTRSGLFFRLIVPCKLRSVIFSVFCFISLCFSIFFAVHEDVLLANPEEWEYAHHARWSYWPLWPGVCAALFFTVMLGAFFWEMGKAHKIWCAAALVLTALVSVPSISVYLAMPPIPRSLDASLETSGGFGRLREVIDRFFDTVPLSVKTAFWRPAGDPEIAVQLEPIEAFLQQAKTAIEAVKPSLGNLRTVQEIKANAPLTYLSRARTVYYTLCADYVRKLQKGERVEARRSLLCATKLVSALASRGDVTDCDVALGMYDLPSLGWFEWIQSANNQDELAMVQQDLIGILSDMPNYANAHRVGSLWKRYAYQWKGAVLDVIAPPDVVSDMERSRESRMSFRLLVAQAALKQYSLKNGRSASSLADLNLPEEYTIDPYSPTQARFKTLVEANRFQIYSVGRNGVDDQCRIIAHLDPNLGDFEWEGYFAKVRPKFLTRVRAGAATSNGAN